MFFIEFSREIIVRIFGKLMKTWTFSYCSVWTIFYEIDSLDAGIQDSSTSISIVVKFEQPLLKKKKEMVMKVTNIYKHEKKIPVLNFTL